MGKNRGSHTTLLVVILISIFNMIGCMQKDNSIKALFPYPSTDNVIDPNSVDMIHRYYLVDNMSAKLVYVNQKNDFEYILADEIIKTNDHSYLIKIKKNAVFSNGDSIKAMDFVNSFKRLILYGSAHIPVRDIIRESEKLKSIDDTISGLEVIDEKTFKVNLSRKVKDFLYYLSLADMSVIHSSVVRKKQLSRDDWKVIAGAYFLDGNVLRANKRFINYNKNMPEKIEIFNSPTTGGGKDLVGYDIGTTAFIDKNSDDLQNLPRQITLASDSYTYLVYLHLNPESKVFRDISLRRSIYKKLTNKFKTPDRNKIFKKSKQYFLPEVAGVNLNYDPNKVLSSLLDEKDIPSFKILSTQGTRKYTFTGLDQEISNSLGVQVEIDFIDLAESYYKRIETREFDAYLLPVSMNYSSPLEALNHLHLEKNNMVKLGSLKLKNLILELQDKKIETGVLDPILDEMALDATVIPLFYVSSPKFYNQDTVDASLMNVTESMVFWRLRVK